MKNSGFAVITIVTALLLSLAGSAQAAKGFYVGTGIGMAFPDIDNQTYEGPNDAMTINWEWEAEPDPSNALSLELLHFGYNFTDRWGFGVQYGAIAGEEQELEEEYGVGYLCLSGRYSHDTGEAFVPYIEAGLGSYAYMIDESDIELVTNGGGFRFALGGQYYIDNIYISPELSYHTANLVDGEMELDVGDPAVDGEYDLDENFNVGFFQILLKVGYHWRK